MIPKAPCLNCKDREPLCHSICERYISFRKEIDRVNKNKFKESTINMEVYYARKHNK